MIKEFTDLRVWQAGHGLVLKVYAHTKHFPKDEFFGITSQLRRAAISVTSNIAEGYGRQTYKDKCHFYYLSHGSLTELHAQILLARDLHYLEASSILNILDQLRTTQALLRGLIKSTKQKITKVE
jgi:four helix bundle protein